jgi:ABC-type transport system involved in cytochrome bd biosynthesis fused ATPase/permease subunit
MMWRSLDPWTGEIFFNGTPIKNLTLQNLRQNISILTQETTLFEGSLRDNLDMSNLKSDADIKLALEDVKFTHPDYKVNSLAMKISEDGGNISEG